MKKHKNPHVGRSVEELIAEQRQTDPVFAAAFDTLRLARRLRELRESKGLTQLQLARRLGTTQSVIARMESGRVLPKLDLLHRLALGLGLRLKVDFAEHARSSSAEAHS